MQLALSSSYVFLSSWQSRLWWVRPIYFLAYKRGTRSGVGLRILYVPLHYATTIALPCHRLVHWATICVFYTATFPPSPIISRICQILDMGFAAGCAKDYLYKDGTLTFHPHSSIHHNHPRASNFPHFFLPCKFLSRLYSPSNFFSPCLSTRQF